MSSTLGQSSTGQTGEPTQTSTKGRPLRGVASQSYNVVSWDSDVVVVVATVGAFAEFHKTGSLQASAWEQTANLSPHQEQAIELLTAHCSQRPVPEHVSKHLALYKAGTSN